MNTNNFTAFRTNPFLFFIPNEMSNTKFIYHFEIFDHAHSILGSVTLIQLFQPGTGKTITTIGAILDFVFGNNFALFNPASVTVF